MHQILKEKVVYSSAVYVLDWYLFTLLLWTGIEQKIVQECLRIWIFHNISKWNIGNWPTEFKIYAWLKLSNCSKIEIGVLSSYDLRTPRCNVADIFHRRNCSKMNNFGVAKERLQNRRKQKGLRRSLSRQSMKIDGCNMLIKPMGYMHVYFIVHFQKIHHYLCFRIQGYFVRRSCWAFYF